MTKLSMILSMACMACMTLHLEAKRTLTYHTFELGIEAASGRSYALAVLDRRDVVCSEAQEPDFVGYIRSATMIAYPIRTESGNPFTGDIAQTVGAAFESSEASVATVDTDFRSDSTEVIEALLSRGGDMSILVVIHQWRNDTRPYKFTKVATEMLWDISVYLVDKDGLLLDGNHVRGRDGGLSPSGSSSTKKIQKIIDVYYPEKMEELFSGVQNKLIL